MSPEMFKKLEPGDLVRWAGEADDGHAYVVVANYGDRVTAVRIVDMTNPPEWDLVSKVVRVPFTPR